MTTSPHALYTRSALTLLILVLIGPGAGPCAAERGARDVDPQAVDALVRRSLRVWGVPGVAVAIVRAGEVVYLKGHGVKEISGNDPVTPDTLFPIASCTKGFTTTAMALL